MASRCLWQRNGAISRESITVHWRRRKSRVRVQLRRHRAIALDAETAETIITNASSKQIQDEGRRHQKTHSSGNPADDGAMRLKRSMIANGFSIERFLVSLSPRSPRN